MWSTFCNVLGEAILYCTMSQLYITIMVIPIKSGARAILKKPSHINTICKHRKSLTEKLTNSILFGNGRRRT